jgi:hypothetical protein
MKKVLGIEEGFLVEITKTPQGIRITSNSTSRLSLEFQFLSRYFFSNHRILP